MMMMMTHLLTDKASNSMSVLYVTFDGEASLPVFCEMSNTPFVAISPRSTMTWSGSSCKSPIYGSNIKNNHSLYLKSFKREQTND